MLKEFRADLHIHTLLSGCAENEMLPGLIIMQAESAGLDIIAVCDHNSCENAGSVIKASKNSSVKVLPGMEVHSVEGVHVLCVFENIEDALQMQRHVYDALPEIRLNPEMAGGQIVVDENDDLAGFCDMPIDMPTDLDIESICKLARELGAVVIPAHIDRRGTGLMDVLGFLPEDADYDGLEISANIDARRAVELYPDIRGRTLVAGSDAHWLSAVGERHTILHIEHRSLEELRMALAGVQGRSAWIA